MYALDDYDYRLPPELIAQAPADPRDQARLLMLNRTEDRIGHGRFADLADILRPSDVLVVNNTQVVPARLWGRKPSGGKVEVLVLDYPSSSRRALDGEPTVCRCLIKSARRTRSGTFLRFEHNFQAQVLEQRNGYYRLAFEDTSRFKAMLKAIGQVPLPPYIARPPDSVQSCDDRQAYQTIYASQEGAVAAPTAGLHFTTALMDRLRDKGIDIVEITLHVGYGTFLPVRVDDIRDHRMHPEVFTISADAATRLNTMRAGGRRIVAVGTTSVRTLEYASDHRGRVKPGGGSCDLYIYPGYRFKAVDALITNFHLPRSTLLMLVAAFAGRRRVLHAYAEAVRQCYRFYSYGDAMLIL